MWRSLTLLSCVYLSRGTEVTINVAKGNNGYSCAPEKVQMAEDKIVKVYCKGNFETLYAGSCYFSGNDDIVFIKRFNRLSEGFYRGVQHSRTAMATEWICRFIFDECMGTENCMTYKAGNKSSSRRYVDCKLDVIARTPDLNYITVNGVDITTNPVRNEPEYQEIGFYSYYENEMAKLSCHNRKGTFIKWEFNGIKNKTLSSTLIQKEVMSLYIKLDDMLEDNAKFACHSEINSQTKNVILLVLNKRPKDNYVTGFRIGNLYFSAPENGNAEFVYEYYDNEEVYIQTYSYQCWIIGSNAITISSLLIDATLRREDNGTAISCFYGSSELKLHLVHDTFSYLHPYVTGLPFHQTLWKYSYNTSLIYIGQEITKSNIWSCSSQSDVHWYHSNEVETTSLTYADAARASKTISQQNFYLDPNYTQSWVKCSDANSITFIHMLQKPKPSQQTPQTTKDVFSTSPDDLTAGHFVVVPKENGEPQNMQIYIVAASVVGAVVIISIVGYIICTRARKRTLTIQDPSDINYENLPRHNEGPMQVPSQWDEDLYTVPIRSPSGNKNSESVAGNIADMYAKPIPKHLRTPKTTESPYVDVRFQEEPNYATPGVYGNGDLYTEVVPKSKRHRELMDIESPYAEIVPTKYENVFDGSYANAGCSKDEYVEPAYCDVNKY